MEKLLIRKVNKAYANRKVLSDINVAISFGDVVGLIGDNGAGKTSLINIIAGEDNDFSGSVVFPRVSKGNFEKASILPQTYQLPTYLRVEELFASLKIISSAKGFYNHCYEYLGLNQFSGSYISELSAGQMQTVYAGLVLSSKNKIILLDEPTSAVDTKNRNRIWDLINYRASTGAMILFSSHSDQEIEALATRMVFMVDGKIVNDIEPSKLSHSKKTSLYLSISLKREVVNQLGSVEIIKAVYDDMSNCLEMIVAPEKVSEVIDIIQRLAPKEIESMVIKKSILKSISLGEKSC